MLRTGQYAQAASWPLNAHWRTFGEIGRTRIQGWLIGGKLVFALEGTFISAFAFMIRTTAGAPLAGGTACPTGRVLSVNCNTFPE